MNKEPVQQDIDDTDAIRRKRIETVSGVWLSFTANGRFSSSRLKLSPPLVNEVVEHYIADRHAMKQRYKIPGRIQLYKVAGLMASSIMRYRPVVPIADDLHAGTEFFANEFLAIYHGVAICGEFYGRPHLDILDEPWFSKWRDECVYFLHCRNYTPESLCMLFLTLSAIKFPEVLAQGHE